MVDEFKSTCVNDAGFESTMTNTNDNTVLPRLTVDRIVKDVLPDYKLTNDARELIANCCTEFVQLVSSRANQLCKLQNKINLNHGHILMALSELGFADLRMESEDVVQNHAQKRKRKCRLEDLNIPEEELLRQQEELLAEAREEYYGNMASNATNSSEVFGRKSE